MVSKHLRSAARVLLSPDLGFVDLVNLAELDHGTAFQGAVLRGDMRGQNLAGFDFTSAQFQGCDLRGADLAYTVGVTPEMLATAITDATTILPRAHFWRTGIPPSWADDWGRDQYGPWVTFRVPGTEITQRMRWCPAGKFMMGSSPETDPAHFPNEAHGPEVTFAQGFWMFDTAVTQALWTAVTHKPTRRSTHPVTEVSWHDAQAFIEALNRSLPGLNLSLPSEAQWEYACRAGTTTPYSFGETIDRSQVNFDSTGTVPAGSLPPNPWGLHEMHGNVWEWCQDTWHKNFKGAPDDVSAWLDADASGAVGHVVRGGSWLDAARDVRAASRSSIVPARRDGNLGFRCVRVQAALAAEPAAPRADGPEAERGPSPTVPSAQAPKRPSVRSTRGPRWEKPVWARNAGRDAIGPYADIAVPGTRATQRLRWCPPGTFMMGSPDDEPGRDDDEGPRHRVTLAHGFWIFDTPCTQALWRAVMGNNPSYFKSRLRPVEQVSFEDTQKFLQTINDRIPNLNLALPTEAQWEYACRAGTETATYAGPIEILGANNAPVLDDIAWYGGNSGKDFDLKNGYDSSDWPDKQYDHTRAGTRLVAKKLPTAWGVHDMLGNIFEWCGDHWHDSYEGAPDDGSAWLDADASGAAYRVVRGGSWDVDARGVRAAFRGRHDPVYRGGTLGFRCVRVQASGEAEPSGWPADGPEAERGPAPASPTSGRGATRLKRA